MVVNVSLDNIAGLGAPVLNFGPAREQTSFSSCAVSPNGRVAYFGRTVSHDREMRNLVVASLDASGNVIGIPRCYPTSDRPLAPIGAAGYDVTTITALLLNSAKRRLYVGEMRQEPSTASTPYGLNIYTLDTNGYPTGAVRTHAVGKIPAKGEVHGLLMHPKLPLLYVAVMTGVAVQPLGSEGEPTGEPTVYDMGSGKYSLGISADAKYLYMGTFPDTLEVVALDTDGHPTAPVKVKSYTAGTISGYLQFTMGARAIYMVRPDPSGSGLPILALWPLDNTTGQPIGLTPLARSDIHPPLVGATAMAIAADNTDSRLWIANVNTFSDAFTGEAIVSGITPTSFAINTDGTLGVGTPSASLSLLSNAAVLVPTSNRASPRLFNFPVAAMREAGAPSPNRVKGYQCRIAITAASGGSFPLTMNDPNQGISFALTALNTPSVPWVELDSLLQGKDHQVRILISAPVPFTSLTVQFDLADSSEKILKSVVETVQSNSVGFLIPGYGMSVTALTGDVTGLETYSQRSADYLKVAKLNPVAAADRPKQIITDCYQILGGEANNQVLTNLAQTMQAVGFNTVNAYEFQGLDPVDINHTLNSNGFSKRSNASYRVGQTTPDYPKGGIFSFETCMTPANIAKWADNLCKEVQTENGGSRSQIVSIYMVDEPGWYYPQWLNYVNDTKNYPGYLEVFQKYLEQQGATYGFTYTDLAVGATSWSSLHPIGQSVGNPLIGGTASIQNRRLYYWTMRFYSDAAVDGMKMGSKAVTEAIGHPVATAVDWALSSYRWYWPSPDAGADTAMGWMDWASAGRTSAHTLWIEGWIEDIHANAWSVYAALMRSLTQAGTQSFGAYVVGQTMGTMPAGGKYKIFALLGNGAKRYCGYTFGPLFQGVADGWSEKSSALVNPGITSGNVYSEYADANRLIGRSESILYPGKAKRSPVAILLPGASCLWDTQPVNLYYDIEVFGLYYAISHGYNFTVDYVDEADVASGALTDNDYHVLYVVGPNVSAAAQTAIDKWITTSGTHNRQLVLGVGAGVADEYNCPTPKFDGLAGLVAGSRAPVRDVFTGNYPIGDYHTTATPYTATIQVTNTEFYFNARVMNIRGPFQMLSPRSGPAGPTWTDQVYTTSVPANQAACVTKRYTSSGVSNFVTAFGFFPGWQYYASPDFSHTNQLPQGWSIMAREIAVMPVIRLNPPRTVLIYNGKGPAGETLTEANQYLSDCPVEALRLNVGGTSPMAISVVLLNWGGAPFHDLKFKVPDGIASPARFTLASGEPLTDKINSGGINGATMTLHDVDVVLVSK
jgi:hypothetical protein